MFRKSKPFMICIALTTAVSLIAAGCSSSSSGGSAAPSGETKTVNMRLGHVFAANSVTDQASKKLAELVEQKTSGAVKISVFPASQIGGDEALGQNLSRGTLDMAFLNQGSLAGMDPLLDFSYLPYIAENNEQADKLFYGSGIIPTTIKETLKKHNIHALGFYELEFRGLTNSKHLVKTPADMKGLKLRVPGSRAIKGFFEAVESQAVSIPMPELYTSLQQGVVDGQDNGLIITYDNKLHETNKYITRLNHVYASGTMSISQKTWDSLTPEQQKALEEAAAETQQWQISENRKLIDSYVQKLKDENIEVIDLSPEEIAAFKDLGQSLWDKFADVYGANRMNKLREEIAALK
ncbi:MULTISPECIES: TRAP transporter substrate-binding protein [unclassified Paenibacillus]|uniref:TRAP transporter substrate-binding protein n=1 Tax=unclassified Paenibacillus TaxID=185978 RepID=UPI001AE9606F|nr:MULTISPECIES: TRAP transporter substrate-binding protein [unclassified Paenibacillus]MBP1153741.1 tripartite ATP-independent transporter DctP family solute receptor [Paenibacillus sp. PvP091]MBP1170874.1 tripartite ATP-independent transporter DctP family solute receptor [Paenibacillus sp. PvR098]MBP2441902.1 tripartite ATP-independent transporter DctP family solute receptor [Paenibacillus sp. PvP052]